MDPTVVLWFLIVGVLLTTMGTVGPLLQRWWLTCSVIYLGVGLLISPLAFDLLELNLLGNAKFLEHLTEVAVIISLFSAGMRMRMPLKSSAWLGPILLASLTMVVTVGLVTAIGYWAIGLPIGMAVLLGAVLAPTDPVLAGEVQLKDPDDDDRLRLLLTGEAGFNDGTAFPFVLLAVGLVGMTAGQDLHALGDYWWKWVALDVVWRIAGGLAIGFLLGHWVGKAIIELRKHIKSNLGADEMLTLGFIALVYGAALASYTYAFLAVFAAAVASRRLELKGNAEKSAEEAVKEADEAEAEDAADAPEHAEAMLARSGMVVADTMERLVEVLLVVIVGVMLGGVFSRGHYLPLSAWWFVPLVLLIIRPAAVLLTLHCQGVKPMQRAMVAWFGIRGIGTLYYLAHAFGLGVLGAFGDESRLLADLCLITIAVSVILHGTSVSPLMRWYGKRCGKL